MTLATTLGRMHLLATIFALTVFAADAEAACPPGRYGATCAECPGGAANPCSGNGVCSDGSFGSGACTCNVGYAGAACQYARQTTCNGHGDPTFSGGCNCDVGFAGAGCNVCAANRFAYPVCRFCQASTTCNAQGACNSSGLCQCNLGVEGSSCERCALNRYNYPSCVFCEASTTCQGHGSCSTQGSCVCSAGFGGPNCAAATTVVPALTHLGRAMLALLLFALAAFSMRRLGRYRGF